MVASYFKALKKTAIGIGTLVRSMWMVNSHALRPRDTILYPEQPVPVPPRFRGRIVLTRDPDGDERCVACNLCAVACPVGCISLQKAEREDGRWYPEFFRINFSRCVFCGLCEEACPTTAIQLTPDFELGEYQRQNLVYDKEYLLISGTGKYPDYNYYRVTGMATENQPKGSHQNEAEPIDLRSLLPYNDSKVQTNLLPRRRFLQSFCLLPSLALMACVRQDLAQQDLTSNLAFNTHQANQATQTDEIQSHLQQKLDQILPKWEADLNAKIGMAVIANLSDKPSLAQYRGDQRFPVNSTIKAFLAAHFLAQVDQDLASLDKKITLKQADLLQYAPVCKRYFAENKPITCQELCFAMLAMSDNTAANLILAETGGLPAFNQFLAKWVKNTHIAHDEPNINHAQYGDLLDTTPPSDYLMGFYHLLMRAVLSPKSKQQLLAMMRQNQVADDLFRKTLPKDWQIADRTGAGDHGSRSIIALVWDQMGNQHLIALFIAATEASFDRRNQAIAEIGEQIFTLIQDLKPQNLKQQNLIS